MILKKSFSLLSFLLFCVSVNATPITPFTYNLSFHTETSSTIGGSAGGSIGAGLVVTPSILPDILLGNLDNYFFKNGQFSTILPGISGIVGGDVTSVGPVITDPTLPNSLHNYNVTPGIDLFRAFSGDLHSFSTGTDIGTFTVDWHYNGHLASSDPTSPDFKLSGMLDVNQSCAFPPCSGVGSLYPDEIAQFSPYPGFSDKFYTDLIIKYNSNAGALSGLTQVYQTTFPNDQPMIFQVTNDQLGRSQLGDDKFNHDFRFQNIMVNQVTTFVPEPNSLSLVGVALTLLYLFNRRKQSLLA